jgi:SAM-dependent methyltransferase
MYRLIFDSKEEPNFVHFVPKDISLADPNEFTPNNILGRATVVENVGVQFLNENVLARIQVIQNRWWNASHQNATATKDEKEMAIANYKGLCELVERFLGTKVTRSLNDQAQLFGLPIGASQLSDGQKVLLQFCVAIHAQADKLSKLIVLMDEPENHLHPGAMLDAIVEIEKTLTDGQLWISTHSIALLAHFDPDCIWWVEEGTVQHAGSQPEKVLRGLVGDSDRIGKIGDFLGLPASLAVNNFAHQCLLPPAVVANGMDDPQNKQIRQLLEKHRAGETLRIVDFGAGRGRLVSAIRENSSGEIGQTKQRIDYLAYDKSPEFGEGCKAAIARLYGDSNNRYFNEEKILRATIERRSVDVLVLCNTLHEIDPMEWIAMFSKEGIIQWLLKPDGFLLIVEDMEMRVGEKAHQRGFIVLDTADIRALFNIKEKQVGFITDDARKDGRLKAHLVPASCVGNVTGESLKAALRQLKHLAKEEIKKLRQNNPSYRQGRKHAFFVQQFANAELALEVLGE